MIDTSLVAHEHRPLRKVLMHRPGAELDTVTEATLSYYNFAAVPNADRFRDEFDQLAAALRSLGAEVVLVGDVLRDDPEALDYISRRANMTYTRDLSVTTPAGGLLCGMALDGRRGDPAMIGRVYERLGIPVVEQLEPQGGILEGGGVTFYRGDTVIAGRCDRANDVGLARVAAAARRSGVRRMITIPCAPGTVHIDGMLVLIDEDLALADPVGLSYAPAIITDLESGVSREQPMLELLREEGVDLIEIDESRDGWAAANFVMVGPRQIVGYEWAERVMREVERRGGRAIGVSGAELRKGNGGPHCMTCTLERG